MLPGREAVNVRQRSRNTASARRRRLTGGKLTTEIEHFGYDLSVALRAGSLPSDAHAALEALIATLAQILGESAILEALESPPASAELVIERLF
jgi:hypothetical protein